jgi:hypothetical protein
MKKLFVIFASVALVAAFAVSASAADWSLYGSARMATYMTDDDPGGTADSVDDLQWDLQGNSRIGANVKNDAVSGQFELAVGGNNSGATIANNTTTRRLYGVWDMGSPKLKVGQDYTPVKQFISGQVFDGDLGLLGNGTAYGSRRPQLALDFGQFQIALINPSTSLPGGTGAFTTTEDTLPKLEAAFGFKTDMFNVNVIGGYQTFDAKGPAGVSDESIDSTVIGVDGGVNLGPAFVKAAFSVYSNGGNAGYLGAGAATSNATNDIDDSDTTMYALVAGFKASDKLTLEAGYGYREIESDVSGAKDDEETAYYVQAVIQLAPGVFVIPEFGVFDRDDDATGADEGDLTYYGAKWQINF